MRASQWRHQRALARQRSRDRGAIIFIVAMTLALLGAMGIYALSATTAEQRTSGYQRQAAQAHYVTELATMSSVDAFSPANASFIENQMRQSTVGGAAIACDSTLAARNVSSTSEIAKRCVRISKNYVERTWISDSAGTPINLGGVSLPLFATDGFGPTAGTGAVSVSGDFVTEVTEPITSGIEPGFDQNNGKCFRKFTLTSFGTLRVPNFSATLVTQTREIGRARVVTGPFDCGD